MGYGHRHGCGPRGRIRDRRARGACSQCAADAAEGIRARSTSICGRQRLRADGAAAAGAARMFGSGELRLVLLKLIADEPRHGYDLIRAIEELTGGDYAPSPGVVYPTLTMLAGHGPDRGSAGRRIAQGVRGDRRGPRRISRRMPTRSRRCSSGSRSLRRAATPRQRPPIGRAIGNLMTALRHRVAPRRVRRALVHEIADDPRRGRAADRAGEVKPSERAVSRLQPLRAAR